MVHCPAFSICYFRLRKKWCLQNFCWINKWLMLETFDKSVFKSMTLPNNLVLICKFKAIILCSVHSTWLVKHVISAKMQFVKTLTRIVIHKSRVAKSNSVFFKKRFFVMEKSCLRALNITIPTITIWFC